MDELPEAFNILMGDMSVIGPRPQVLLMMKAKVFENGRSQAVRLPKEFRLDTPEVSINRIGSIVLLMPPSDKWAGFMQGFDMFSEDFMQDGRVDNSTQERESL